ncbi:DegT/DnrJ/EryC1/StrS family aminotransferase [Siansivirga zeaxanthinifaciens]|uniref:Aminotransferase n=1 Tax=Siansivirga zeaxanthinifaciens CC-SAMT-1 TaxID=1454006 RepID=A0A0C5WAK7_9FLAO|nr:DegT/DnrJ/EryC1/StrS family aminotransferase [Siansivirga zeaxanthinifaciens]AJR02389.1 aminotransferase [Siansivirga zeaxanthinifaciens CC-SAMT-1]
MVEFLNLQKINSKFEGIFKNEFEMFLNNGKYILSDHVLNFEKEFAHFCGSKYCIGTSNGLDALQLIFEAYKLLGKLSVGDEVIVPANTYIASVLAIANTGLIPVLVEPEINSYNIDVKKITEKLTLKTKAIMGVHLYGQLYNVSALKNICETNNLILIEDAAQAHGAIFNGEKSGNLSDAAAFSFYPTKNLGALGDAGAVTTNNESLATVISKLRNYGRKTSFENDFKGYNCRLDELQAMFLRVKLKYLDEENEKRKSIAKIYYENIKTNKILLPECKDFNQHVFHLFVVRSDRREEFRRYLLENSIETQIHYVTPIHHQKAFKEFSSLNLPITTVLHQEVLSLPLNPSLEEREISLVVDLVSKFR